MKMTLVVVRDGDLWVAEDRRSGKWWTAHRRPDGTYYVVNHLGRDIREGSVLHRQIAEAVAAAGDAR